MDSLERKIRNAIREGIWWGVLHGAEGALNKLGNPYATEELLEQSQEFLNSEEEKVYRQLEKLSEKSK